MSYFSNQRPTRKVELTDPAYWVEIYTSVTYKEQKALATISEVSNTQAADELFKSLIVSWNLDDESGVIVPVTQESLDLLSNKDSEIIMTAITESLGDGVQKKSSTKE